MPPAHRDNTNQASILHESKTEPPLSKLRNLQQIELIDVCMKASQIGLFMLDHQHSLREFNFQGLILHSAS